MKILSRLTNFGVSISSSDFLSASKAVLRKMLPASSSFFRLPVSVSRRSIVLAPLSPPKTNISVPMSADTPTKASPLIIKGVISWCPCERGDAHGPFWLVSQQHTLGKQIRRELDAGRLEPADERRPHAGGLELAVRTAVGVDAQLLVAEDALHDDHVLLHVHHLGDGSDLA